MVSAHTPVCLSAWASTGPEHLNDNDLRLARMPERTVLPQSWGDSEGFLEKKIFQKKKKETTSSWAHKAVTVHGSMGHNGVAWIKPFKLHSFSQVCSWMGGGVMKITLSAETPAEASSFAISFRFSEYSCKGTCCWGFLSARQRTACQVF